MMSEFTKTAKRRGVPFARIGMRVKVQDKYGFIFDVNRSANFDIYFDNGMISNCHPNWMMTYFDDDGNVLKNFDNDDTTYEKGKFPLQFEVWTKDFPNDKSVMWAKTLGVAKSMYLSRLDADWLSYIDIRGRKLKWIKIIG